MTAKIIKTLIIALMITFLPQPDLEAKPIFPEVTGWQKGKTEKKDIYSSKALQGTWSRATFNMANRNTYIEMTILSGKGFGPHKVSPNIMSNDRPVGSGATYRTFFVDKYPAILENYPYVGSALSVSPKKDLIIIFESNSVDEKTLIEFSKKALKNIVN